MAAPRIRRLDCDGTRPAAAGIHVTLFFFFFGGTFCRIVTAAVMVLSRFSANACVSTSVLSLSAWVVKFEKSAELSKSKLVFCASASVGTSRTTATAATETSHRRLTQKRNPNVSG